MAKQIAVSVELVEGDLTLTADEEALQTIVNNLIDNGLKYTAAGGRVWVRSLLGAGTIAIEVEDTGVGIAEAELTRIFERFYRVDKARSRALGGTGLGLSIVKHLVQAHGGAVSVVSTPGKGSTFRVELPRTLAPKKRKAALQAAVSD
jgi:two-component system phosphate regulon sensor histidine kinase PhoR